MFWNKTKENKSMSAEKWLGAVVKDRVSGYEGVVTGYHAWMTGCDTVTVRRQGVDKDGKPFETQNFDVTVCEMVKPANRDKFVQEPKHAERRPGGPQDSPRRDRSVSRERKVSR